MLGWGANAQGQLGDGTTTGRNGGVLMRKPDGSPFEGVQDLVMAAGASGATGSSGCTVLLRGDGSVWATGDNTYGCIGDGTSVNRLYPVPVRDANGQPLVDVVEIRAGWTGLVAKKRDGSFQAWGDVTGEAFLGRSGANVWRSARPLTGFGP